MSTIKVDSLQTTGGAGLYPAKAWVSWDGTGTVSVFSSGNVSSVLDGGTGLWTVNFTNSMVSSGYVTSMNCGKGDAGGDLNVAAHYRSEVSGTAKTTSAVRVCSAVKSYYTAYDLGLIDLTLTM